MRINKNYVQEDKVDTLFRKAMEMSLVDANKRISILLARARTEILPGLSTHPNVTIAYELIDRASRHCLGMHDMEDKPLLVTTSITKEYTQMVLELNIIESEENCVTTLSEFMLIDFGRTPIEDVITVNTARIIKDNEVRTYNYSSCVYLPEWMDSATRVDLMSFENRCVKEVK